MSLKGSEKEIKTKVQDQTVPADVIDIDLSPTKKKSFRIDGDNSRIIYLNTSDVNIAIRLEELYPKLLKLTEEASTQVDASMEEGSEKSIINVLKDIDSKMRELLNELFDSDIADKVSPDGSLYDPFNGKFRFEYIIDTLAGLYDNNFKQENELIQKRLRKHTGKYTRKK